MAAEAFGIATGAIGLAATVFQTAKGIRDIIHTVSPSTLTLARSRCSLPARACRACRRSRASSTCYERMREEIDLLAELYNEHKERLDQTKLTHDLERLRAYAYLHSVYFAHKLTA